MTPRLVKTLLASVFAFVLISSFSAWANDDKPKDKEAKDTAKKGEVEATTDAGTKSASTGGGSTSSGASAPAHATILKDTKSVPGMINVYHKGTSLYAELTSSDYNSEFIVLISIARGISQGPLLGGMSLNFCDDWIWAFRKIDDKVHIIRRNVRFRANKGTPVASAVSHAYTDSVLFSLPIMTQGPRGGDLVDLTPVFMSDLPQISMILPGFAFAQNKSTWAAVKGFKENIELEVAATYASGGMFDFDTVPDSRGVTLNVHYSISKIPSTGYQARLADDRVGYFLTVVKDFSSKSDRDNFVRYINRWQLEKPTEAGDGPTPPKEHIKFYIEKTVPHKYRQAIREGILEWNKAYEKAGWINAIEVDQQTDDDDKDPEDIRYNFFRWITANAGFAMGPSRVNPYTGQILDADIIFDADFLTHWKTEFETLTPQAIAEMTGGDLEPTAADQKATQKLFRPDSSFRLCMLPNGMANQLAFGAAALAVQADPKILAQQQEKLIQQGLKEVTMHEVGHTLGLRHNFKASKWRSLKDLNDPAKTKDGMVASVMDYSPTNIVPKDWKQGDFYTQTLGPYDVWAIQYGYTALSGGTQGEVAELKKIAARSGEPALAYATDEDTRSFDPDPDTNRFDLGSDPLEYAKTRAQIVKELVPGLVDRMVKDGDDYTQARRAFNVLLSQQGQAMYYVARNVGGLNINRSHKADKDAKPPMAIVDPKLQRTALDLLEQNMFSDKPFQFPPEIYNKLSSSTWSHWGTGMAVRKDFPIHDIVLMWQERMLAYLMSPITLERIHDAELKVSADTDAFTAAELIERLTKSIFSEVESIKEGDFTNRKPAISSLRRNLQRSYLRQLSYLAMGRTTAPDDCSTVAYAQLSSLQARIEQLLKNNAKLDSYTRGHLQESANRIQKVLDARLTLLAP